MNFSITNPFYRPVNIAPSYDHTAQIALVNAMATTPPQSAPTPIPQEPHMSFKSVLSDIGHIAEKVFTLGIAGAKAVEPFVAIFFPKEVSLFASVTNAVGQAEASAVAAGKQDGTGAQKLALVVASIQASVTQYEKDNGITTPLTQDKIEALANAAVAFLNALPSSTTPAV